MDTSARAPGYDLFKLVIAIFLLVLFLFLFRQQGSQTAFPGSEAPTLAGPVPASTSPFAESTLSSPQATLTDNTLTATMPSAALSASPSPVSVLSSPQASSTPQLPPESPSPAASPTQTATPFVTSTLEATAALIPSPSATPVIESTEAPIAGAPSVADVCEAATARARLQAGTDATILRRLNFRSSPGIRNNWILTNLPGTTVEVVGGPECIPHLWGAYLWWQIRLPDGRVGWSAEGSLHGTFYFMEPLK